MLRTLIIEDSTLFRQVFQESLHSRFPSMEIYEATDGQQAYDHIKKCAPDLVFIDIHLENESGLELARKIKADYPRIVTIILTNYDLPEYREAALRYKANHFLPKDSFLKMVDTIVLESPGEDPSFKTKS